MKSLIETNRLGGLQEIFSIIPLTVVKNDIRMNYNTLRGRINNTELLTLRDIVRLAEQFDVDPVSIFKLAHNDFIKPKKRTRKKA